MYIYLRQFFSSHVNFDSYRGKFQNSNWYMHEEKDGECKAIFSMLIFKFSKVNSLFAPIQKQITNQKTGRAYLALIRCKSVIIALYFF